MIQTCPPKPQFSALAILGYRYDEEKGVMENDAIMLANDDTTAQPRGRLAPRFLTFPVMVHDAGPSPGKSFYAQAEKQWGRNARFMGIPWEEVALISDIGGLGMFKSLYYIQVDQNTSDRINRGYPVEHEMFVLSRGYYRSRVKAYFNKDRPETHYEPGHSHMFYEGCHLLDRLLKVVSG